MLNMKPVEPDEPAGAAPPGAGAGGAGTPGFRTAVVTEGVNGPAGRRFSAGAGAVLPKGRCPLLGVGSVPLGDPMSVRPVTPGELAVGSGEASGHVGPTLSTCPAGTGGLNAGGASLMALPTGSFAPLRGSTTGGVLASIGSSGERVSSTVLMTGSSSGERVSSTVLMTGSSSGERVSSTVLMTGSSSGETVSSTVLMTGSSSGETVSSTVLMTGSSSGETVSSTVLMTGSSSGETVSSTVVDHRVEQRRDGLVDGVITGSSSGETVSSTVVITGSSSGETVSSTV